MREDGNLTGLFESEKQTRCVKRPLSTFQFQNVEGKTQENPSTSLREKSRYCAFVFFAPMDLARFSYEADSDFLPASAYIAARLVIASATAWLSRPNPFS